MKVSRTCLKTSSLWRHGELSLTYPDETLRPSCASSKSLRVDYTQDNQAFSLPIYVHEKCRSTWGVIC